MNEKSESINTNIEKNNDEKISSSLKKSFSIYFKILMNYLQMTAIIRSFDLKWPFYANDYFDISSKFSSTSDVLSVDCILNDYQLNENKLRIKTIIILAFPFIIISFIILVAFILKIMTKKSQTNRIYISVVIISVFLQPTIIQVLFDNLSYTNLNNIPYLMKELSSRFDDENHINWVL